MGKLIWGLAEAELRIMRAAADTHSFAFPRLGENMKDLEDLERRPDHPAQLWTQLIKRTGITTPIKVVTVGAWSVVWGASR